VANPPLKDKDGNVYRPDTFTRNEGGVDVETQAVAVVNPLTGVVIDLATQTTLAQVKAAVDNLLLAAADIKTASEAINAKTTGAVSVNNLPATQPVSGTVSVSNFPAESSGLTNTELRQAPVPVSGSVSISNFPSSSTGLTDAELRATPVPMNGTVTVSNLPANQTISGQVSLDAPTLAALETINANTGGLTNTELRASAVPVAGTVELGTSAMTALNAVRDATDGMAFSVLTDEQLRQAPLNVESATLNDVLTSINSLNETMLYFVTAILDKMPLLTSQDRAMVEVLNTITANIASNQTLTAVTNVSNINNLAGGNTSLIPYQMGASYIYPNIIVS